MIQEKLTVGLDNVSNDMRGFDCIACIQGKMTCGPFQAGHETAPEHLGRLHSDVCGPMDVPSLGKNRYFCTLMDDKTHYLWFLPCSNKSDFTPWFIQLDTLFTNHYRSHSKTLQSDRGSEYVNTTLESYCAEKGI